MGAYRLFVIKDGQKELVGSGYQKGSFAVGEEFDHKGTKYKIVLVDFGVVGETTAQDLVGEAI